MKKTRQETAQRTYQIQGSYLADSRRIKGKVSHIIEKEKFREFLLNPKAVQELHNFSYAQSCFALHTFDLEVYSLLRLAYYTDFRTDLFIVDKNLTGFVLLHDLNHWRKKGLREFGKTETKNIDAYLNKKGALGTLSFVEARTKRTGKTRRGTTPLTVALTAVDRRRFKKTASQRNYQQSPDDKPEEFSELKGPVKKLKLSGYRLRQTPKAWANLWRYFHEADREFPGIFFEFIRSPYAIENHALGEEYVKSFISDLGLVGITGLSPDVTAKLEHDLVMTVPTVLREAFYLFLASRERFEKLRDGLLKGFSTTTEGIIERELQKTCSLPPATLKRLLLLHAFMFSGCFEYQIRQLRHGIEPIRKDAQGRIDPVSDYCHADFTTEKTSLEGEIVVKSPGVGEPHGN